MQNNPYQILNLPVSFAVDASQLQKNFIALSAANHPDRHTDPLDQADAADRSATINAAYRTLLDPQNRADVLLRIFSGNQAQDEKALDPALLMEMMEAREKHEEAVANGNKKTIDELMQWAKSEMTERQQKIAALFAEIEKSQGENAQRDAKLKSIRMELNAIKYFQRMIREEK